jgi:hypothetical protein
MRFASSGATLAGAGRSRLTTSVAFAPILVAAGALMLLLSACGSSSASPSTTSRPAANETAKLVRYSACMRSHGLPNFPDPDASGNIRLHSGSGSGPRSPRYDSADRACRSLLPNGGAHSTADRAQRQASLLAFAACMRRHGIPNFPDPDSHGQFPSSITQILRNKAQFRAAESACPQHFR